MFESRVKKSIREKRIKAFSDLAILPMLTDHSMTGYKINIFFFKKLGIIVSSAIYLKPLVMKKDGWIKSTQKQTTRNYFLIEEGLFNDG